MSKNVSENKNDTIKESGEGKTRLKLAIQKSGRLAEESKELLDKCGISFNKSKDQLFCAAQNFPLDVFFVRDDDIPAFVASKVCQVGIVGQNVLNEENILSRNQKLRMVEEILPLGFGRCRLSLAVPHGFEYQGPHSLQGKIIATSYQGILSHYIAQQNIGAEIVDMRGSVEIAPRIGMADAICDLVSSGATLAVNGLKEVETIFQSEAVLIRSPDITAQQNDILNRLITRITGVMQAQSSKYIMLHCPVERVEQIRRVIPGCDSPTILALQGRSDTVAVHAVCNEGIFWETMEQLKSQGASDILVLPIEKMLD